MAIAFGADLGGDWATTNSSTTYTLTVTTPTTGRVAFLCVELSRGGAVSRPTPSGLGLTWTFIAEDLQTGAATNFYIGAWYGLGTPSGTTLTITLNGGGTYSGRGISLAEFSGVDTTTPTVQSVAGNGNSTGLTLTLGAAPTSGAVWGGVTHEANEATTHGTGWTEIGDGAGNTPSTAFETNYQLANDQSCDWTWTTSALCRGVLVELAATATAVSPPPFHAVRAHKRVLANR